MRDYNENWKDKVRNAEVDPPLDLWESIESVLDKPVKTIRYVNYISYAAALLIVGFVSYAIGLNNTKTEEKGQLFSEAIKDKAQTILQNKESDFQILSENGKTFPILKSTNFIQQNPKISLNKISIKNKSESNSNSELLAYNVSSSISSGDKLSILNGNFSSISLDYLESKGTFSKSKIHSFREIKYENASNYQDNYTEEENQERRNYIGIVGSFAPFHPNMSFKNFVSKALYSANSQEEKVITLVKPSLVNSNEEKELMPENKIQAKTTLSIALTIGKKLGRRFSIESGIRYLQGNAQTNSNVFSFNYKSGKYLSFVESEYLSAQNSYTKTKTLISGKDKIRNRFDYLSIPVLLNFDIPIINKLDLQLSAGLSADLFIQNQNSSKLFGESQLKPINSNYKSLNASFIAQPKLSYSLKKNWKINAGGFYQELLHTGLKSDNTGSFKPQMLGVSLGANYLF